MKATPLYLILACAALLASCATTTTTITDPDGRITKIESKGPDAASITAAASALEVIAPLIRPTK